MKQFVVLFAVLAVAAAAPQSETDGLLTSALKFVKDCGDKSMVLCVKVRPSSWTLDGVLKWMDLLA